MGQNVFPAVSLPALGSHLPDIIRRRTTGSEPELASRVEGQAEGSTSRQRELEEHEGMLRWRIAYQHVDADIHEPDLLLVVNDQCV